MILKYFDNYKLQSFVIDESNYSSIKQIIHKLWKLILEHQAEPQYNKFWIFDDNNNYLAVVNTIEGRLNFIKNQKFATPKDIIKHSGFNIKWDELFGNRFRYNVLSAWKYNYFKAYGYAKNYDLDINLFIKAYKKLIKQEKISDDLKILNNWKQFYDLTEFEQLKLKHKYSSLFTKNIGTWQKPKIITFKQFNTGENARYYYEKFNITEDNFFIDDKKVFEKICELNSDKNQEIYKNIIEAIKSDKDIVDNLLANGMIQTTEDTICFREFGIHSYQLKDENYQGFVSASLIDRKDKWLGQDYNIERCEPFILPKGFWYVPNFGLKNDPKYIDAEPLEPGEILIWNPNLCKL